jgi:hypothetical protein
VIEARRQQFHFGEGLIAEEVRDLREAWMKHADQVLEDDQLVATVYEALAKRSPKSRTRGRRGTPAEVVLRLLLSIFEPTTEIIRKGKASKPTEFGKLGYDGVTTAATAA